MVSAQLLPLLVPGRQHRGRGSAQKAAAAEVLSRVREEVATRNAASMRGA